MRFASKETVGAIDEPLAGPGDAGMQRWSNSYFLVVCSLVLFCFCLATRIPLRSSFLSGWDPVEYALAIHHFDISQSQPHAPGYIVFVGLARLLFGFVHDDNLTLTTLAALFSALSTVLIFLLAFCMYDRPTALLASALWATCPLVWFPGLGSGMDPAAGFSSLATALAVYLFLRSPSRWMAVCAGGVYALAAGLRPDQLLLLAPLFLFPFWRSAACRRWALYAFCSAMLVYLAWYIPTVASAGGYSNYTRLVGGQFSVLVKRGSIFFGASPIVHIWMLTVLISGLALGLLPLLIILAILWTLRRPSVQAGWTGWNEALLLTVWAAPFLLFYSLIFIGRVAFCVACLPPILLLLSRWVVLRVVGPHQRVSKRFWSLLFFSVAINVGVFFLVPRVPEPAATAKSYRLSQLLPEALNLSILSCEYDQIRFDQSVKRRYFAEIRELLSRGNSAVVLIQRMPLECLNFRVLDYYFPNVPVYAVTGLSATAPGVHHPLIVSVGKFANESGLYQAGKWSKRTPTLAVARDRVLLLYSKGLHVEVNARDGSAQEVVAEDRDNRLDSYQIYVLSLTPTSSVDVTSGQQTISIVE
jgi:4-amino-4-deoxy-L-arabinose transferase-like glycosyltransferase